MRINSSVCNGPVDETGASTISPRSDDKRIRMQVKRSQVRGPNVSTELQTGQPPISRLKAVAPMDVGTPNATSLPVYPDVVSEWIVHPKNVENFKFDESTASAKVSLDFDDIDVLAVDGVSNASSSNGVNQIGTNRSNAKFSSASFSETGSVDEDALRENFVMKENAEKCFKMMFSHFSVAWINRTISECLDCFGVNEVVRSLVSKNDTLSIIRTHASAITVNLIQLVATIAVHSTSSSSKLRSSLAVGSAAELSYYCARAVSFTGLSGTAELQYERPTGTAIEIELEIISSESSEILSSHGSRSLLAMCTLEREVVKVHFGSSPFPIILSREIHDNFERVETCAMSDFILKSFAKWHLATYDMNTYYKTARGASLFGQSKLIPHSVKSSVIIDALFDILFGGQGSSMSYYDIFLEGWNLEDVEPVYKFASTVNPVDGYTTALSALCGGDSTTLLDEQAIPFGVARSVNLALRTSPAVSFENNLSNISIICNVLRILALQITPVAIALQEAESATYLDESGHNQGSDFEKQIGIAANNQSCCVRILSSLITLWSRYPKFQRSLLAEGSEQHLQGLVESVIQTFYNSAKAKLAELLYADELQSTDNARSSVWSKVEQLLSLIGSSSCPLPNLTLYRSCGTLVGRLSLQLLAAMGDSYFLSATNNEISLSASSGSHVEREKDRPELGKGRACFGYAGTSFFELLERSLESSTKSMTSDAPPSLRKLRVCNRFHVALTLLINAAVRRRIISASGPRMVALARYVETCRTQNSDDNDSVVDSVWQKVLRLSVKLSNLVLTTVVFEHELSGRTSGAEINFESRVMAPLNIGLALYAQVNKTQVLFVPVCESPAGVGGPDVPSTATSSAPSTMSSLKGGLSSMSGMFRKRSSSSAMSDSAPQGEASASSGSGSGLGGMMGNLLKKGIQNIDVVSTLKGGLSAVQSTVEGLAGRQGAKKDKSNLSDEEPCSFETVANRFVAMLRFSIIYTLELQKRNPDVLLKVLQLFLLNSDSWSIVSPLSRPMSPTLRQPSLALGLFTSQKDENESSEQAFVASLCSQLYSMIYSENSQVLETVVIIWGILLTKDITADICRQMLIVDVVSPNDSSMVMKFDLWNYEGVGFAYLAKLVNEYKSKGTNGSVGNLAGQFKKWFLATPESLRDSFNAQILKWCKPIQKQIKSNADQITKRVISSSTDDSSVGRAEEKIVMEFFRDTLDSKKALGIEYRKVRRFAAFSDKEHNYNVKLGAQMVSSNSLILYSQLFRELRGNARDACTLPLQWLVTPTRCLLSSRLDMKSPNLSCPTWSAVISDIFDTRIQLDRSQMVVINRNVESGTADDSESQIQSSVAIGVIKREVGNYLELSSIQTSLLKEPLYAGEWAVDASEGHSRMRQRLR
jgi:hypothetical protein